jgi:hypothetical protein
MAAGQHYFPRFVDAFGESVWLRVQKSRKNKKWYEERWISRE